MVSSESMIILRTPQLFAIFQGEGRKRYETTLAQNLHARLKRRCPKAVIIRIMAL